MEYLMTYGWAILIVIIVAAALYALGVFNPATWTGTRSTGFANIGQPTDWIYQSTGVFNITLKNNLGSPITIVLGGVTAACGSGGASVTLQNTTDGLTLGAGGSKEFSGACAAIPAASSYSSQLTVQYTKTGGTYTQTDTGTVTGAAI